MRRFPPFFLAILSYLCLAQQPAAAELCSDENSKSLVVTFKFEDRRFNSLDIISGLNPNIRVGDSGSMVTYPPAVMEDKGFGGPFGIKFCLSEEHFLQGEKNFVVGPNAFPLRAEWETVFRRDSAEISVTAADSPDFAIPYDFSVSESLDGKLVLLFSIINPAELHHGFSATVSVAWGAAYSCAGPAPFRHEYLIDTSVSQVVRVFEVQTGLTIKRQAEYGERETRTATAEFAGDFCTSKGILTFSTGLLSVNRELQINSYQIVLDGGEFISPSAGSYAYFLSGATLDFTSGRMFPSVVRWHN